MQPCSREMQGLNSLLNNNPSQIPNGHDQSQIHHHAAAPFDPTVAASQDDFLEQMLSSLPSCSWTDLKSPWVDLNGRDLSDESPPTPHQFDDSMILASKLRQHQISGGSASPAAAAAAAKMMMQQQQQILMAARGAMGMPLTLGNGVETDVVDGSSFKSPTNHQGGDNNSVQALYNGFSGSLHGSGSNQPQQFHHGSMQQPQSFTAQPATGVNQQAQPQGSGSNGGAPAAQPRQRVRARRGQATDPHSIAERLRRERIAERMKALQELVPNANKTDKASMLDEIIDYVKFLQLQVKVLSMSRLGGAGAVAPLVADMSSEGGGGGDCIQGTANGGRNPNSTQLASTNDSLTVTEHQVAKLMEEDMGSAMQYLQGKGLCLMPISLATAISTATCHTRNPLMNSNSQNSNNNPLLMQSNGDGPSSPSMSVLTVQSATMGNGVTDGSVKDAASVSKP
ncbi:hypothetical protein Dsin_029274 [Dipteronia sinensis]|uniref:BHLH domain-containing protein n=1 Tax=Dipteronia sinensis TaxID=43782 RepID=A0AAE0DV07_9ROSI|nr:hypothetical protein Dsin_029274 [Dipteronia sinensis]